MALHGHECVILGRYSRMIPGFTGCLEKRLVLSDQPPTCCQRRSVVPSTAATHNLASLPPQRRARPPSRRRRHLTATRRQRLRPSHALRRPLLHSYALDGCSSRYMYLHSGPEPRCCAAPSAIATGDSPGVERSASTATSAIACVSAVLESTTRGKIPAGCQMHRRSWV